MLILAATSAGIPGGPHSPTHRLYSKPGTDSAIVGTSGSSAARFALETPSATAFPPVTCGTAAVIGAK